MLFNAMWQASNWTTSLLADKKKIDNSLTIELMIAGIQANDIQRNEITAILDDIFIYLRWYNNSKHKKLFWCVAEVYALTF